VRGSAVRGRVSDRENVFTSRRALQSPGFLKVCIPGFGLVWFLLGGLFRSGLVF
jgi:hypothetical protein